jgi:hypothetical protein
MIGIYIGIAFLGAFLLMLYPDMLTVHYSPISTRVYSLSDLVAISEYLTNFVYLIHKDMRAINQKSILILIVTYLSSVTGIILYLVLLFANEYKPTKIKYGSNS